MVFLNFVLIEIFFVGWTTADTGTTMVMMSFVKVFVGLVEFE